MVHLQDKARAARELQHAQDVIGIQPTAFMLPLLSPAAMEGQVLIVVPVAYNLLKGPCKLPRKQSPHG